MDIHVHVMDVDQHICLRAVSARICDGYLSDRIDSCILQILWRADTARRQISLTRVFCRYLHLHCMRTYIYIYIYTCTYKITDVNTNVHTHPWHTHISRFILSTALTLLADRGLPHVFCRRLHIHCILAYTYIYIHMYVKNYRCQYKFTYASMIYTYIPIYIVHCSDTACR